MKDLMKSPVAHFVTAIGLAAIGAAGVVLGAADDAPGGSLLGILLIVGAVALGVRTAQHRR